ncbi:CDC53 Cell division control protein 53 [Candida maltosa Xu316]|uniref:Cullin family profile domain-containing protein n=1 Tax=Candida maltosa (strain Xu316) TaxID=1245528 RepID=M3JCE5_CANMX|nr:hypothetical protein G210_5307 [Candida maltosa Xu316]
MSTALPQYSDLTATWSFIQPGLEYILGAHGEEGVTANMYMNCYTAVYNYCVNKSRRGTTPASIANSSENNSYSLAGEEIYKKLQVYLTSFIRSLKRNPNESFLEFYVRKWTRFTIGAVYMNNVFDYMNRYWVQKERSDGRKDIYDVNTLSLIKWRDEMFKPHDADLIEQILNLIQQQRDNLIVDTNLISSAIKSLVFLSIDMQDLKKPNLIIYVNSFEVPFLKATTEYYSKESSEFLTTHNVVDYMKKCETRLSEEVSRSNNYLEERTKKPLLEALNSSLIEKHATEMYDQFLILLEQNQIEHIQRMYKLLARVPKTLDPLATTLEEYIKKEAAAALEEVQKQASNSEDKKKTVEPKVYVHTLIQIYNQFNDIVIKAFNKDTKFIKSLDNACRYFVNHNPIATPKPRSPCRTPELLARYADGFLKSNSKDNDMNADNLMIVFKFISERDSFEEHYRRLLAKRLINGTSKSEELEESVIHRLQEENSIEYTSKMTKMFTDIKASDDLKLRFRDRNSTGFDFAPMVLARSTWPFHHSPDYDMKVAPELEETIEMLKTMYLEQSQGKQIQWLWNHGRAELKAHLSKDKKKPPFTFTVSQVQLMVILAYNKRNSYTLDELVQIVGIKRETLQNHVAPLVKYKLLNETDNNLVLCEYYPSKKTKVNFISAIAKASNDTEVEEISKEIEQSRLYFLEASIVRIMKSKKVLSSNHLLNEVLVQTGNRFTARIIDVKKAIDGLIDKDYLKRNGDEYEYIS